MTNSYHKLDHLLDSIDEIIKFTRYNTQRFTLKRKVTESLKMMQDEEAILRQKKFGIITHSEKNWYDEQGHFIIEYENGDEEELYIEPNFHD